MSKKKTSQAKPKPVAENLQKAYQLHIRKHFYIPRLEKMKLREEEKAPEFELGYN